MLLEAQHHLDRYTLPLGAGLKVRSEKTKLTETPTRYRSLVKLLNEECAVVVHTCYMLFRLFQPGESTYFDRKSPVQPLFATSHTESAGYPRLTPRNKRGSATIANLRRDRAFFSASDIFTYRKTIPSVSPLLPFGDGK